MMMMAISIYTLQKYFYYCSSTTLKMSFQNDTQKYEERCSNHGYLQCGICNCDPKYGGPTCNCTLDDGETTVSQTSCMDSSGQIICSNQLTEIFQRNAYYKE